MSNDLHEKADAMRRSVLGDAHVDRSAAHADAEALPLLNVITDFAWGDVWTRPGLEKQTRSFMNLAMLTALNRPRELRVHIRGALNNGISRDEIREALLHTFPYCGAPAALDAFHVAREVFDEIDAAD